MNNEILYLKINDIFPNPLHENKYNLYDLISLSDSLKNDDFTEPLKVIKLIFADHNKYFIYDNNLLYSASVCADISYIPCIVINTIDTVSDDSINYFNFIRKLYVFAQEKNMSVNQLSEMLSVPENILLRSFSLLDFNNDEIDILVKLNISIDVSLILASASEHKKRLVFSKLKDNGNVLSPEDIIKSVCLLPDRCKETISAVKDVRFFYNSIEHAADIMKNSGANIILQRHDENDKTVFNIVVYK